MQLTFDRKSLTEAFTAVAGAVPSRTTKDILKNVKLVVAGGVVTLLGTDGEIGLRCAVPGATVDIAGEALLPTARILAILRELSDDVVKLDIDKSVIWIRCGYSEFRLSGEDPADFPPVATFDDEAYFVMKSNDMRQLIRRTIFATDVESTRYALAGIQVEFEGERVTFASTDSRRLAVASAPCSRVGSPSLPTTPPVVASKAMTLIERNFQIGEIHIAFHANDVAVRCGGVTITSQLVQGRFPDWRRVVPGKFSTAVDLVVAPFYGAIRQAMIVTNEENRGVDFIFDKGCLKLASQAADIGQSKIELPIAYEHEQIKITFDPRYVADFLKAVDSGSPFKFQLITHEDPAVLVTEDGYTYVIMPLSRDR